MRNSKAISLNQEMSPEVASHFAWTKRFASSVVSQMPLSLGADKKKDLIHIQLFVAIASSYLLLVRDGEFAHDPISLFLLVAPLGSILIFLRLPDSTFSHRLFPQAMAVADTAIICTAIVFNKQSPWDLFLVSFFSVLPFPVSLFSFLLLLFYFSPLFFPPLFFHSSFPPPSPPPLPP